MSSSQSSNMKGITYAIAGFTSWAIGDAAIKYLTDFYSIYAVIFYNATLVLSILVICSPWLGGLKKTFSSGKLKLHLSRGIFFFLQMIFVIYGFSHMSLFKTYAIVFSAPFMTSLLAMIILKEKVNGTQWLVIALGFMGILVILRPGLIPLDLPSLSVLAGALAFSATNIFVRIIEKPGERNETLLSWALLPEIVILICVLPFFLPEFILPEARHIWLLILMAVTSAVGVILVSLAFRHAAAAAAAPFHYIQMVWGVILGFIIFGDVPDIMVGIGASVIVASGLWLVRQESTPSKNPPAVPTQI
ncbi:MAG: DMT family transporter [Proteobacteria bacterium]|nr:DMT family transporter [Pseudomonadota bacterium]